MKTFYWLPFTLQLSPFSSLPTAIKFFCILQFLSPISVFSHFSQAFVPNRLPLTRSPATSMLLNQTVSAFPVILSDPSSESGAAGPSPAPPCGTSWAPGVPPQPALPSLSPLLHIPPFNPDVLIANWPSLSHWSFPFLYLNSLLSLMALSMIYKYASLLLLQKETQER